MDNFQVSMRACFMHGIKKYCMFGAIHNCQHFHKRTNRMLGEDVTPDMPF